MAIDRFFTGFEGGEISHLLSFSDPNCVIIDDGKARTGQFALQCNVPTPTATLGRVSGPVPTAGINIVNGYATGTFRVFFKIIEYPSASDVMLFGYGLGGTFQGNVRMDVTGRIAVANDNLIGDYNSSPLPLNVWFRCEMTQTIIDTAGTSLIYTTASTWYEDGTLIETVSRLGDPIASGSSFLAPFIGHADAIVSSYVMQFDDCLSIIEDNGYALLPAASRITRVDVTGILENTPGFPPVPWQGDYRSITEIPFDPTDEMVSTSSASQLTFRHKTAAQLLVNGVAAVNIVYRFRALDSGPQLLIINTIPIGISVSATYPIPPSSYMVWVPMSNATFDDFSFGIRTQTTTARVGQMYMEVLHSGGNYWPVELARTGTWQQKVISYVGNGTFREITGFGFKPQVVLIKKVDLAISTGSFKLSCMGGSRSKPNGNIVPIGRAIMNILDDGFTLGPSSDVNEPNASYIALCIKDGGYGYNCYYLDTGAYVGNGRTNTDIPVNFSGIPNVIWVSGEQSVFKTDDLPGDDATPLDSTSTNTGLISGLAAGKFSVGSNNKVNNNSEVFYFFAIANQPYIFYGLAYGNQTAIGNSMNILPFRFEPNFVIAKAIYPNDAQWRQAYVHITDHSDLWSNTVQNTTGIIAMPAGDNGFALGLSLSIPGINTRYLVFAAQSAASTGGNLEVNAGADQNTSFGVLVNLVGTVIEHQYPCNVITMNWSQVSGPGTATFTTPNAPSTGVTFSATGSYVLRLSANNGLATLSDDVNVFVSCPGIAVNAGSDKTIVGTTTTLFGSTMDDFAHVWTQVSGPGTAVFANASDLNTSVTFNNPGVYILRLAATNQCREVSDDVAITVLDACVAPSPAPVFSCN